MVELGGNGMSGTLKPAADISPQSILLSIKNDISLWKTSIYLSTDFAYLISRYEAEGMAFLCQTMCLLGKEIETSLIQNRNLSVPEGWRLRKHTRLPYHFYIYFSCIYNDDGSLRTPDDDSKCAVIYLRQLFLFWSKWEMDNHDCDDVIIEKFMTRITQERHTFPSPELLTDDRHRASLMNAKALIHDMFGSTPHPDSPLSQFLKEPWGRHGPGAVANHEDAGDKWNFIVPPMADTRIYSWRHKSNVYPLEGDIPSSRAITVPKDFRGPRIICIEPKEMQFAQQGLLDVLVHMTHDHYLTRRSINFNNIDQSQAMCFDTRFATIDLKDASDMISLQLVKFLFPRWVYRALVRYRTPLVNDARSTCFATMGSALCFPVQTLVFWALSLGTVEEYKRKGNSRRNLTRLRVFGDDIVVPQWVSRNLCDVLTACGLSVNLNKTCIDSLVREACGEWVYAGMSARILKPKGSRIRSVVEWNRAIDTAHNLDAMHFYATARLFRSKAYEYYRPRKRYGKSLQRPEIRVPLLVKKRSPQLEGYNALYAWLYHSNTSPFLRGTQTRVKWGWVASDSKFPM
jgi:hypothetical protein